MIVKKRQSRHASYESLTERKKMKNKPTHFAVEDIKFYAMDEDNEIIVDEKGEQITYRLKDDVRFKPLEYLCEGMDIDLFEEVK